MLDAPTRRLCEGIAAGPPGVTRLAVVAPGEYGKTALLDHLDRLCTATGVAVVRVGPGSEPGLLGEAALVLADDVHTYDDAALDRLAALAADERTGLVVAARPRPRPAGLAAVLSRLRGQIVLRPFDRAQVATHLAARLGTVGQGLPDFVLEQTGGVPGLVHRLATAPDLTPDAVPAGALAAVRHVIDGVPPDVLRLLLAVAAGAAPDLELLGALLGLDTAEVTAVVDTARATGLFGVDGVLLPLTRATLAAHVPPEQHAEVRQRLAGLLLDRGLPVLEVVRPWLADPVVPGVARAFEAAAAEALDTDPALAARLLEAAVAAGLPAAALGARRAEAVALAGDMDTALRLADEVVAGGAPADRAQGAAVAAAALAHRGHLARSADLLRWAGEHPAATFAPIALLGVGRLEQAQQALAGLDRPDAGGQPPTLLSGALTSVARGMVESVTATATAALSGLVGSAEILEPLSRSVVLPDSPAALGALVALHCGELTIAEPLLERALAAGTGGPPLAARHRLLHAWVAMLRGDIALASERAAEAGEVSSPRDWLFAVALEVGLARRASDLPALRAGWARAGEAVVRHPVDLFTLLPFGELAIAAARLGDGDRLAPHLARAAELLAALGDPPLWSTPLHWSGLHAAVLAERPADAERAAAALAASAGRGPFYAAMSAAAQSWLKVLAGDVEPAEVEAAAYGLRDAGLWWDGARLAGQAAIRTADRKAMLALLDCARLLQGQSADPAPAAVPAGPTAPGGAPVPAAGPGARLSERELQVARLVLEGLTYKQVGARLFISAKTVEHHMARMRHRLGATSRAELLTQLRQALGG
ncbi:LuxR family transcriptional regulator [Amycolatopsis suaedae]|uniref:LuxR family transcriptional regulator n=1 Tax=Amycolatopsis suaedae TaxID=2510978 RepID=A0A4V2EL65_9PSEU|nr:LuxR family transcriptional regulator [Amycolatopsis suaedae]